MKIMAFRCSNNPDYITTGWAGILTAAQMGANVINCSWGSFGGGNQSVINAAYNNYGSIIVASSGNGGDDGNTNFDFHAPSGLDNVISVSAIGPNDNFSCWATAGETVDLCAPGENIRTTSVGGGTVNVWGTSFSSPMTAGAVALLWSKYPSAPKEWIEEIIISSTDEFSDMYGSCQGNSLEGMLGSGRLNIYNAILYADSLLSPSLLIEEINYLNDSDGDGVFNPGEQVKVKLVIGNEEGVADAENVVATISSEDDRIAILDNTITFENTIGSGESSFTLLDHFLVYAFEDVELGDVPCIVHIQAGVNEPYYEIDIEIDLNISLNQYGFPTDSLVIESSPLIADTDGNLIGEIYAGAENGSLYGYMIAGIPQPGFPFSTGDNIRSSPAVGDVDADGNNEIVFGSYDGKLYILSTNGSQELAYTQSGYIIGSPALVDLDGDSDLEIVFTTQNGNSGMVYAIHHDGNTVDGFPVDLDEKMLVGAAVGDLEGDGSNDIVVCTWDDNIYAIDNTGATKAGFPFTSTNRFNAPPTLVDLDGDGDLEIIAGNDSGLLHVLHHDGTEMTSYDVGDDIRGGISVADLNDDGSYELLFAGYDDMIHVWNPMDGVELDGWPVDMDYNSLTEPVTADLDNDGDLEVVTAMKSGMVYIFHHDATLFNGFPTNLSGNIESSPAIGDLDARDAGEEGDTVEIRFSVYFESGFASIYPRSGDGDSAQITFFPEGEIRIYGGGDVGWNILDQTYNEDKWNHVLIQYINGSGEYSMSVNGAEFETYESVSSEDNGMGGNLDGLRFQGDGDGTVFYLDGIPGVEQEAIKLNYVSFGGVAFNATEGKEYEIQVSHDLKQWSKLGEIKDTSGDVEFIDPRQPLVPFKRNFYRVKAVE